MKPILTLIALSAAMLTTANLASASTKPAARPKVSVYFPVGVTGLTDEARAVLDEAAENVKADNAPRVIVVGYGDYAGSDAANYSIASLRASIVEQGLIERGVSPEAIVMTAETHPGAMQRDAVTFIGERKTDIIIEPKATTSF